MPIYKAGTLLIPSGPAHSPNRKHLHIVCTDTDKNGENLVVSVTEYHEGQDDTCILLPHEHDFLKKPKSYVAYNFAKMRTAESLQNGIDQGTFIPKDDMNGQAFLRVKNGICRSSRTPRKIKNAFGW